MAAQDEPKSEKQNTLYVGALAKGLRLLRAFDESHTQLSLSELAARTGLDKSATQRFANTLHLEGMLEKDPRTRRYSPSHAWLQLAYAYCWSDTLVARAMPRLIELSQHIGETVNLAELSNDHIIYVSRLPCKRTQFAASIAGRRLPALSTSAGRVMLSTFSREERETALRTWPLHPYTSRTTLDRDRIAEMVTQAVDLGYVISHHEMILNETTIAAPVRIPGQQAFAAVQCSVSSYSWPEDRIRAEILPYLQDAANSISPAPDSQDART
ncbi:IclR family transcriptional regulator [Pseudodonghicola xiamenensis]|uniref:IclR family transcriptional regulator n=1 Tax=Pseudodonghicola xiamenensis TaxID=337702 RepID=A0A8J3H421_9RHOB|nr:IclR family transcriptional regulator [Pseudodonghicola xiamenensis]TNE59686.1 MAG: IclR family transcriptional regulator [Sphingomonadales bacterium]GHG78836.1 IclR family transcriptional regulator [Pseudodonghicola xiamenensis]